MDLDVDYQISTLYGLNLGLRKDGETFFLRDWSPSFVAHNLWFKMRCVSCGEHIAHDAELGGSSPSRITNITWANIPPALQEFAQCTDCTGDLSIAMSYNYFSQEAFTIGEVMALLDWQNLENHLMMEVTGSLKLLIQTSSFHQSINVIMSPRPN